MNKRERRRDGKSEEGCQEKIRKQGVVKAQMEGKGTRVSLYGCSISRLDVPLQYVGFSKCSLLRRRCTL